MDYQSHNTDLAGRLLLRASTPDRVATNVTATAPHGLRGRQMSEHDGGSESNATPPRGGSLLARAFLARVLAQTEISFSNSMTEAFWRSLNHQWLCLHPLDSVAAVERLVRFYVEEHNTRIPHAALGGLMLNEM